MPTRTLTMRSIRELYRLKYEAGLSHERIARALSISKGVVAKYVAHAEAAQLTPAELLAMSEDELARRLRPARRLPLRHVQPDYAAIHQELKRRGMTLWLLWEEHVAAHPGESTYKYSQFAQRYRDFVARLRRSMRQVHRAGEKLFVDYAGQSVPYGEAGERAQIFVAALGASSYTFACATPRQTLADWVEGLVRAFEYIEGVTELVVPDNARALIADPDRYEPQASATLLDLAAHYGTAVLPARPYKPKDKAKVEQGVLVVERWILARLRHRRFATVTEVDLAVGELLGYLNSRPFKRLPGSRRSAYETLDRPALRPLPTSRYELARYWPAKVNIDYHVVLDGHYYSVPHELVHAAVELRVTTHALEILCRGKRVAAHLRSAKRGGYSTVPEHLPAAHRAHLEWSPQRLIRWGGTVGPSCAAVVVRILETRPHPEQGYRACLGLLRLAEQHGRDRLEAACTRAIALGAPSYRSVKAILQNKLETTPLTAPPDWTAPDHTHVRGPRYYQ
ncbi:MAG: IS21 family transposase [Gemmatimonadales bacterium]|nr:IS21 family transposase [Gemmatimonadales bacterium]